MKVVRVHSASLDNNIKQWVLVTGADRRIGKAIALLLAASGWGVVVHCYQVGEESSAVCDAIIADGGSAVAIGGDLLIKDAPEQLMEAAIQQCKECKGQLTALVNNASVFLNDEDDSEGWRNHRVNADAPIRLAELFFQHTLNVHIGDNIHTAAIVNFLDGTKSSPTFSHYCASKLRLRTATIDLAKNMAPQIRVNAIDPGPILPSTHQSLPHFNAMVAATPLTKPIEVNTVAAAVRFLVETPSITGITIPVDGGTHLYL